VEVQNYAFTTKSLYVGHMDYQYLRWQVIDSPGVLDRPLEERNTIEMQAITALAHLNCCIIFILDLDPLCKYSIFQQITLFRSLKALWVTKPVLFVCNKTDLRPTTELTPEETEAIQSLQSESNLIQIMEMSNLTETNTMDVRNKACDILLAHRLHIKAQTNKLKKVAHRIFVAKPQKRDSKARPAFIPASVQAKREANAMETDDQSITTTKDLEEVAGGHGLYNIDLRKYWDLKNDDWQYDAVPEIYNGKNVSDFVDSDIWEKLKALEEEEKEIEVTMEELAANQPEDPMALDSDDELIYDEIQYQKKKRVAQRSTRIARNHAPRPRKNVQERTFSAMQDHLEDLGYDLDVLENRKNLVAERARETREMRGRAKEAVRTAISQAREASVIREQSRDRSKSAVRKPGKGMSSIGATVQSRKMLHHSLKKLGTLGKRGSADRQIICKMPKHLFTGKRGIGKTDRR